MSNKIIGKCPICSNHLKVTELKCDSCGTTLKGDFTLSKFDCLSKEQQEFALIFIKNAGNIKLIEKEMNISYPTVKKNLDDLIDALGFEKINITQGKKYTKEDIYKGLKNGDLTFEEAEELLEALND